jgi:uncharacterized membrane protein
MIVREFFTAKRIVDIAVHASHILYSVSWEGRIMADVTASGVPPQGAADTDTRMLAIIAYGLFLVGWPTLHLTTIAAVILAYVQRGSVAGTIWESHFSNVIHTFWISTVIIVIAIPLCFVVVGFFIIGFVFIWFLYRTIRGLVLAVDGKPYP